MRGEGARVVADEFCEACGERVERLGDDRRCPSAHGAGTVGAGEAEEIRRVLARARDRGDAPATETSADPETFAEAARLDAPSGVEFDRARPGRMREPPPGMQRVVETIFVDDVASTYDRLEVELRGDERRSEHAFLKARADRAAENYFLAHRLMATAKLERTAFEVENQVVFGAAREAARKSLLDEADRKKAAKESTKAVTDADVDARAATMFPDAFTAYEKAKRKLELAVRALEALAEAWQIRARMLSAMIAT